MNGPATVVLIFIMLVLFAIVARARRRRSKLREISLGSVSATHPARQRVLSVALVVGLLAAPIALTVPGCAQNPNPADVQVLQAGSGVLKGVTALQRGITGLTVSKVLPVPLAQTLTGYVDQVYAKSGQLETAVAAYHAATTLVDRQTKAADVQALLTDINGPIGKLLAEALPEGAVRQLTLLVGNVMTAIAQVQLSIASALVK